MAESFALQKGGTRRHGRNWGARMAALFAGRQRRRRRARLDERTLPDHLKRDMGFLDGNDPAGRHA
jgi:hypothetical protein